MVFSRLLLQSPVSVPSGPQSLRCLRELVPLLTGVQSWQGKAEIQPLLLLFLSADYALGEASEARQWVPCPASPSVSSLGACGPTIPEVSYFAYQVEVTSQKARCKGDSALLSKCRELNGLG